MEGEDNTKVANNNEEEVEAIDTKTVFISGLPYETTEDEVKEFFADCGVIKEIKIPKYQDTGRNIGYGHITFKKKKGVKKVN
jgi:nucleolin